MYFHGVRLVMILMQYRCFLVFAAVFAIVAGKIQLP
jgi:hypothetical protein